MQFFYECTGCGTKLKPKPGDCCVFCSYGSVPCPPIQAQRVGEPCSDPLLLLIDEEQSGDGHLAWHNKMQSFLLALGQSEPLITPALCFEPHLAIRAFTGA